jgi:hypothetical protein
MAEHDGLMQVAQAVGSARTTVRAGQAVPLTRAQLSQSVLVQQGNDLLIVQPNGATVQVSGYYAQGATQGLTLADGVVVPPQVIAAAVSSGTPPLAPVGDVAPLPSSPVAPQQSGRGLAGSLRPAGDSLDALLGLDGDNAGLGGGRGRDIDTGGVPGLSSFGGGLDSLLGNGPTQRLPTELVASLAPGMTPVGGTPEAPGAPTPGTPPPVGTVLTPPAASFNRGVVSADSGNPGNSSPPLTRAPQVGDANNNTFDTSAVGTFNTDQYNVGAGTLNFNSGDDSITLAEFVNRMFTVDQGGASGITFFVGAAPNSNDPATILAAGFPNGWTTRPISDTYSGLGGNDNILTGTGNDLLIGDFDLPSNLGGPLTTSTADTAPGSFTPGNDTLNGGAGSDTLYGGGGADVYTAGNGDDRIIVADLNFASIDGGFGGNFPGTGVIDPDTGQSFFPGQPANVTHAVDTIFFLGQSTTIDLGQNSLSTKLQNIESIDLATNGNNLFRGTAAQIDSITSEGADASTAADDDTDTLFITGDSTNAVQLTGGSWSQAGTGIAGNGTNMDINAASLTFAKYTNTYTGGPDFAGGDAITVYVQTGIAVSLS